jgi:hypothetical protein
LWQLTDLNLEDVKVLQTIILLVNSNEQIIKRHLLAKVGVLILHATELDSVSNEACLDDNNRTAALQIQRFDNYEHGECDGQPNGQHNFRTV